MHRRVAVASGFILQINDHGLPWAMVIRNIVASLQKGKGKIWKLDNDNDPLLEIRRRRGASLE